MPPTIGLVQQASNLGQFAGPVAVGLWIEHFGWHTVPFIVAPAALLGLAAAFVIRRMLLGTDGAAAIERPVALSIVAVRSDNPATGREFEMRPCTRNRHPASGRIVNSQKL
jgi:MFS family permease